MQYGVRSYGNSISETILSLMATIALLDQFEWETCSSAWVWESSLSKHHVFLTDSYAKAAQFCPYISKYIYAVGVIVVCLFVFFF